MGVISIEHSDKLFWLGRYSVRVFTELESVLKYYDNMIDGDVISYKEYLKNLGLADDYKNGQEFLQSFLYDENNVNSIAYSLNRAYDNGIVLREHISTNALSYLQLAIDTLRNSKSSTNALRYSLIPLRDNMFAFWGCVDNYMISDEANTILRLGKSIERLDLYFRLGYPLSAIDAEFKLLCSRLLKMPRNSPYNYNRKSLTVLTEVTGMENYRVRLGEALQALANMFTPNPTPKPQKQFQFQQ